MFELLKYTNYRSTEHYTVVSCEHFSPANGVFANPEIVSPKLPGWHEKTVLQAKHRRHPSHSHTHRTRN